MASLTVQGVSVPEFLYGTAWKEQRTEELTRMALDAGFRGIDTANQRKHYYEAGVGHAIAAAIAAGLVVREDIFLQTKFTYQRGQDHRLPYDPASTYAEQVEQSFASSLEHLQTSYVDSYVLHGPTQRFGLVDADWEVWRAMEALQRAGKTRLIGVSNIAADQLETLIAGAAVAPAFVQNRCYAQLGWDREIRAICRANGVIYQGFSLLTANREALASPYVARVVQRSGGTTAQVVFQLARRLNMLPLTGTTSAAHMAEDLACGDVELTDEEVDALEGIAG